MNILCIMHADFETPGVIQDWAVSRNFKFQIEKPYQGEILSPISDYDLLIIMGGPQSPIEVEKFPYLRDEIEIISSAIKQDKKILGFCLGAQLIGEALGAKTVRSPEKEVGVYPIMLSENGVHDPLFTNLDSSFNVVHWHNDMPGLTEDSTILASTIGCPRQVVKYGKRIYGFQCHLEITKEGIQQMIRSVPEDLRPSKFTQSETELLGHDYSIINNNMVRILNKFIEL